MKKPEIKLTISNRKDAKMIISTRILDPKQTGVVPFHTKNQLEGAKASERNGLIMIRTKITPEMEAILGNDDFPVEEDESKVPTEPGETEKEPGEVVPPEKEPEAVTPKTLTAAEIDKMTMQQMKDFVAEQKIVIEGFNSKSAAEMKVELKKHFKVEEVVTDPEETE